MQLVTTGDGSHTLYLPQLDEHYHSTFGAIQESLHVYIQAGLLCLIERPLVSVLEIGFGTGLNALLACMTAREKGKKVIYHTLEKFPIDARLTGKLNYPSLLSPAMDPAGLFSGIHLAPWNTTVNIHPCFQIHKMTGDLLTFQPDFQYDIIFFDAFAPGKQPEMWSPEIFKKLYNNLNPEGIITTYCVKGQVQRMLKEAGFRIQKLPGPQGKREILRGIK